MIAADFNNAVHPYPYSHSHHHHRHCDHEHHHSTTPLFHHSIHSIIPFFSNVPLLPSFFLFHDSNSFYHSMQFHIISSFISFCSFHHSFNSIIPSFYLFLYIPSFYLLDHSRSFRLFHHSINSIIQYIIQFRYDSIQIANLVLF